MNFEAGSENRGNIWSDLSVEKIGEWSGKRVFFLNSRRQALNGYYLGALLFYNPWIGLYWCSVFCFHTFFYDFDLQNGINM